jgi:ubiquinone/menaquinone biosynthesis C-methylase UbiE
MTTARLSAEEIRDFWHAQATQHGISPAASWSDTPVIDLEIAEILGRLSDGDRVLDVGCANGYSTLQWAAARRLSIRGLDYVPEMIAHAHNNLASVAPTLGSTVEFDVGNILALEEPPNHYDKVVVVRVLINLHNWHNQRAALHQCARVLRPGGLLLLSEATSQGWQRLNAFRREWGLDDVPMPPFNYYVDEERLIAEAQDTLELVEVRPFAST